MSKKYLTGVIEKSKTKGDKVIIRGLANKAVVDRGNDLVEPTAFSKGGLENFKLNPMILFNHNPDFPVGTALAVAPTEEGLAVEVELSVSDDPDTSRIRSNVQQGILRTFSIGFETKDEEQDTKGVNRIKEAELFEVSIVSIPMNQASTFSLISKAKSSRAYCMKSLDELEEAAKEEAEKAEEKETKIALVGKTGVTNDHAHDVQVESETGEGNTISVLGEESADHQHKIVDGVVQASGEDNHTHALDMETLAPPKDDAPQDEESPAEDRSDKAEEDEQEQGKEAPPEDAEPEKKEEDDLTVQTLIFSKSGFKEADAVTWAQEHSFKVEKVDETDDSYRIRQQDPALFIEDSFKTVALTDGVSAIMGKLKETQEKQAEQDGVTAPTVPIKTDRPDNDFGNPHLEQLMQSNVLLGTVISELQKLTAQVLELQKGEMKPADEEAEAEEEKVTPPVDEEKDVNESEDTKVDNLRKEELTDKLQDEEEEVSAAKALVRSGTRYLNRLDERLKRMGV